MRRRRCNIYGIICTLEISKEDLEICRLNGRDLKERKETSYIILVKKGSVLLVWELYDEMIGLKFRVISSHVTNQGGRIHRP